MKWLDSTEKDEGIAGYFEEFSGRRWPFQSEKIGKANPIASPGCVTFACLIPIGLRKGALPSFAIEFLSS
ncbi:MAG: hypothetical protein ACRDE7_14625 [Sphingobacterium sp.]